MSTSARKTKTKTKITKPTKSKAKKTRPAPKTKGPEWNGMCPAGKHGLDWKGQPCDLCAMPKKTWLAGAELANFLDKHAVKGWPKNVGDKLYIVVENDFLEDDVGSFTTRVAFRDPSFAALYANSIFGNVEHRILTVSSSVFVPAHFYNEP